MPSHTFIVQREKFVLSEEALGRLGPACMLVQAIEEAGSGDESMIAWAPPLTAASFAHVMQWAMTSVLPPSLSPHEISECFRAADAVNFPILASRCLAAGPPPSYFDYQNATLLEVEAPYFVSLGASTFIHRGQASVDRALLRPILIEYYRH